MLRYGQLCLTFISLSFQWSRVESLPQCVICLLPFVDIVLTIEITYYVFVCEMSGLYFMSFIGWCTHSVCQCHACVTALITFILSWLIQHGSFLLIQAFFLLEAQCALITAVDDLKVHLLTTEWHSYVFIQEMAP